MTNQENVLWFDSLDAPKHLKATDNKVLCSIGFNYPTTINGVSSVKGEIIEVGAK